MTEEYKKKLTEFLNHYIEVEPVGMINEVMTEKAIEQGLELLVKENVFTFAELRKVILKDFGVLIGTEGSN